MVEARPLIRELIVVEGRDDCAAVLRAVDAVVVATSGFGLKAESLTLIEKAYKSCGIIIFTDPDRAGENIRRKLLARFPLAKQAWLSPDAAEKKGDIGIENGSPAAIRQALEKARAGQEERTAALWTEKDLFALGLGGRQDSARLRQALGNALGIGGGNTAAFLKKLNGFGITKEELEQAWKNCGARQP